MIEEAIRIGLSTQQGLDALAQARIIAAFLIEMQGTLAPIGNLDGRQKDVLRGFGHDSLPICRSAALRRFWLKALRRDYKPASNAKCPSELSHEFQRWEQKSPCLPTRRQPSTLHRNSLSLAKRCRLRMKTK